MTEQSRVTVRDKAERSRFEAVDDSGAVAGVALYRRYDDRVVFEHTEVDDAYEGQGVGSTLVRAALDAVRSDGMRVVARCPFVRSWIQRHPDYADLTS
ncbi:MAG: N-acetyltransferase [Actinobacteria bacterium]|nr:N-acetyltransferase [Actinomycetota bacterium]